MKKMTKAYYKYIIGDTCKHIGERLSVCDTCEHNKMGVCGKCKCVLKVKAGDCDSKCPIGKWRR